MGDLREALRTYDQMGRIEATDDGLALMESASVWLRNEFSLGTDSFVITNTKAGEMEANALAHEIWDEYRVAWLQGYLKIQQQHHELGNAPTSSSVQHLTPRATKVPKFAWRKQRKKRSPVPLSRCTWLARAEEKNQTRPIYA